MYQQHSLEVFQRYFKKDTKTWFSIRLIYSHSLLHNIKYYPKSHRCEHSFFIALTIISQTSVWLSVRIKRKRLVFNRMILFYFKEKPTTPLCHGGKTMKKHMFQWKNLWKRKKMGKTYTRCWTLGWEIAEVFLALE